MTESYSFNSSILENSPQAIDVLEPATFLTWFSNKNTVSFDINQTFNDYKNYVIAWGKKKSLTKKQQTNIVRDAYVQVLRDIVINYSTEEEKRFVTNANLNNSQDLDIIIPFFVKKLKQVCLYYVGKREELKTASTQHNLRGSNFGIEELIKKLIFDAANTNQYYYTFNTNFFPPVSALANDLHIHVEELFDTSYNYYNINSLSATDIFEAASTERRALSSANINSVEYDLYLEFKNAVIDAINQYPFFIETLGTNNFSVNPILSGTELYYLKNRDFIDYLSGGEDKLKTALQKALAPKYLANDFYYLSTGNTSTEYVSGMLFSVAPPEGAATLNLLNRQYPTTATVPNLNSLYTEYEIGRFFIPTYLGLLVYNTPSKYFSINTQKLKPNTVYVFPDPKVIGNVTYNSGYENTAYPLIYEIDVSWNRISRSNQFSFGDVLSNSYQQLYYGYESQKQDIQKDISGLSKTADNIQFWTGDRQTIWANPDIWGDLKSTEYYNYVTRQNALMVTDMSLVKWGSDVYNNEYGLYKRVSSVKSISGVAYDGGILPVSETQILPAPDIADKTIYQKKNTEPGQLYFRNNFTNTVAAASAALSAIYLKYPEHVVRELNNHVYKFNVYGDVILVETENYVIIDKILFNYEKLNIDPTYNPGNYFHKWTINKNIEQLVNEWLVEDENSLYLCFLKLLPGLSGSNYKSLYPVIYKTGLKALNFVQVYPDPKTKLKDVYSLSAGFIDPPQIDIRKIDGAHFSKVKRTNTFNLTYLAKNSNSIPFFVNEQYTQTEPYFISTQPKLFKPFYFIYDNNYLNPSLPFLVKYNASTGGIVGTHDTESYFDVGQQDHNNSVYFYNDSLTPSQINSTGTSYIQFDWQSYELTTVFIGCSAFYIKNTNSSLIWNYGTSDAIVLNEYGTTNFITYATATDSNGNEFGVAINLRRPVYPDPSILEVNIASVSGVQTGIICSAPDSIYQTLEVSISGNGTGIVYSDPYCLDCGSICSDSFAVNTTLNLIASANRISKFSYWAGGPCDSSTVPDCFLTVTNYQSITAVFEQLPIYFVAVYNVAGRVVSSDGYIDCPGRCTFTNYLVDDYVSLSATNNISGYFLAGFIGAPATSILENDSCTFLITQNTTITANYVRYYDYSVSVLLSATSAYPVTYGKVSSLPVGIDCESTCSASFTGTAGAAYGGTLVTLSARGEPGYQFKKWSNGPCNESTNSQCVFTIGQDYNDIIALFDLGYFTLTLQLSGDGFGHFRSSEADISYINSLSGETRTFNVLNGQTFVLYLSALPGNSLIGINWPCPIEAGKYYLTPLLGIYDTFSTGITAVSTVAAAGYDFGFVLSGGEIFGFGNNSNGQLGLGDLTSRTTPTRLLSSFSSIACGDSHTMAITGGKLYATGDNSLGQLGIEGIGSTTSFVQLTGNWKSVTCGSYHTFALSSNNLFGTGYNLFGQLGQGNFINANTFMPVSGQWKQVACGRTHTMAISANNKKLFAAGSNSLGQLGIEGVSITSTFVQLSGEWDRVTCGDYHTMALSAHTNTWFAVGDNTFGQLGLGDNAARTQFTPITGEFSNMLAAYNHTLALSGTTLFSTGRNDDGQLGLGDYNNRNSFLPVTGHWDFIASGGTYSIAVAGTTLYATGDSAPYEVDLGTKSCSILMDGNKSFVATIDAGTFYTLTISKIGTACGTVSSIDSRILCGPQCTATYGAGATVELDVEPLAPGCTFEKFKGAGVYFVYQAGDGITISSGPATLQSGEFFALSDNSLIISNASEGAYYAQGTGISVSDTGCLVSMTTDRTVEAVFS